MLAIRLARGSELANPGPARGKRSSAARAPVTPTSASQPGFQVGPQIRKRCTVPIPIPHQRGTQVSACRRRSVSAYWEMSKRARRPVERRLVLGTWCLPAPWVSARVHFTDADSEAVCPDFLQAAPLENAETELKGGVFFHSTSVPGGVARTRREEPRFLSTGEEAAGSFPLLWGLLLSSSLAPGRGGVEGEKIV